MKIFRCKQNHCLHIHYDDNDDFPNTPMSNIFHYCCKCRLMFVKKDGIEGLTNAFVDIANMLSQEKDVSLT